MVRQVQSLIVDCLFWISFINSEFLCKMFIRRIVWMNRFDPRMALQNVRLAFILCHEFLARVLHVL